MILFFNTNRLQDIIFRVDYRTCFYCQVMLYLCSVLCYLSVELVFIVDSSTKPTGTTGWQSMLTYVNSLIDRYSIGQNAIRVAFIRYADSATIDLYLNTYIDKTSAEQAILRIGYMTGGSSNLNGALDLARNQVLGNNVRSGAAQVIVVITDNLSSSSSQLTTAANAVKSAGITIVGVGITSTGQLSSSALYAVSTNNEAFIVSDYNQLTPTVTQVVPYTCLAQCKYLSYFHIRTLFYFNMKVLQIVIYFWTLYTMVQENNDETKFKLN